MTGSIGEPTIFLVHYIVLMQTAYFGKKRMGVIFRIKESIILWGLVAGSILRQPWAIIFLGFSSGAVAQLSVSLHHNKVWWRLGNMGRQKSFRCWPKEIKNLNVSLYTQVDEC